MARRKTSKIGGTVEATKAKLADVNGPSPNPMTNLILTDLLLRGGGQILRHAVETSLLKTKYDKTKARKIIAGRSLTQTLVATAVARIATRSVPGMILVGGGTLAKLLYDRSRDKRAAQADGKAAIDKLAADGAKD